MSRLVLVALALALAGATPAAAGLPVYPAGTSVGEGVPLKAYATIAPIVHLFGDSLTAKIAIVADTKWVDPSRLRVTASFQPYEPTRPPTILRFSVGRFAQVTYTWTLRCITSPCVPRQPPSDLFHVFRFRPARIAYVSPNGTPRYGISANWPSVEVISQVSPGVAAFLQESSNLRWRFHVTPLAAPTYRISPDLLFWAALGLGGVLTLAALFFARGWYFLLRPRPVETFTVDSGTTLERALALLVYAHEHGDETLQRKAFERIATELGVERAGELTRTARELAWSARTPEDDEVRRFAEQARDLQGVDE